MDQDSIIMLPSVPGLQLILPAQSLDSNVQITLTTFYTDPPYINGIPNRSGYQLIPLSPIVRIEPNQKLLNNDQDKNIILQIPLTVASEFRQKFGLKSVSYLKFRILSRTKTDNVWREQNLDYQYRKNENGSSCLAITIDELADYLVTTSVESPKRLLYANKFPSYQKEISVVSYLSEIHSNTNRVHLKIIIIDMFEDVAKVLEKIPEKFRHTRVSISELENITVPNGTYNVEFKEDELQCVHDDAVIQSIDINWNSHFCYVLNYQCLLKSANKTLDKLASITIWSANAEQEFQPRVCNLTMVSSYS